MTEKERLERAILLWAYLEIWLEETNVNLFSDRAELERLIAWQVLALTGCYDRHAQAMNVLKEGRI